MNSFSSAIEPVGFSNCEDVHAMKGALSALARRDAQIPCGEAGLVFRLMMCRVSREPGEYLLTGSPRLLDRPHEPLMRVLNDLGVITTRKRDGILIVTQGWKEPRCALKISRSISSQFASAILLNCWSLDFPLELHWGDQSADTLVSSGYFDISTKLAESLGMNLKLTRGGIRIDSRQTISSVSLESELDYSSAFAVAALGAIAGRSEILNAPPESLQPDAAFEQILTKMGVSLVRPDSSDTRECSELVISKPERLLPIQENLATSPDLFPVLGMLCGFAEGRSELWGAPHLVHKESNRIEKTAQLLEACGRKVERTDQGLIIEGYAPDSSILKPFDFDPGQDHRLVMAAAVALWAGVPLRILNVEVVKKSFPEFLEIAGLHQRGRPS